jgi:glycosyltransferase involved in cell wall biosynthesis
MLSNKKNLLMLSCHSPIVDPREKWICEDELIQSKFNVQFIGIGSYEGTWGSSKIIGLDLTVMSVRLLFSNFIFVLKNHKFLSAEFLLTALISLPVATLLCLILPLFKGEKSDLRKSSISKDSDTFSFLNQFKKIPSFFIDNKILGLIIRLPWKIHSIIIHRNRLILDYYETISFVPDVIHANDFDTYIAASIFKKKNNYRVIYDSQEFFPYSNPVFSELERKVYSRIDSNYCKIVDSVIAVSTHLGQKIKDTYKLQSIYIIPNACPKTESSNFRIFEHQVERVKFVFQGNFSLNRGLEFVLSCWAKYQLYSSADLYLIGPDSRHKRYLIEMSRKFQILNNGVYFPESVNPFQLTQNLLNYDVGIIPYPPIDFNFKFCCPNKLSQYMSAGLAILSNQLPFVNEIIDKGRIGLHYYEGDPDSFKKCFESIVNLNQLLKFKKASKEFHNSNFNWSNFNQKLLLIYDNEQVSDLNQNNGFFRFKL